MYANRHFANEHDQPLVNALDIDHRARFIGAIAPADQLAARAGR